MRHWKRKKKEALKKKEKVGAEPVEKGKKRRKREGEPNWTELRTGSSRGGDERFLASICPSNLFRKNYGELVCVGFNF